MFTVKKKFRFRASRMLQDFRQPYSSVEAVQQKIAYVVTIELWTRGLTEQGNPTEAQTFEAIDAWITDRLNETHLNDVLPVVSPTAALVSKFIYESWKPKIRELHSVEVSDNEELSVKYEQSNN